MNPSTVGLARLVSQRISSSAPASPAALVSHFGAIQAQDYSAALRAIGLRAGIATEGEVEAAITDRSIVRSWPLRGTLHLVAAGDLRWMLSLLSPRLISSNARRFQQLGLDDEVAARSNDLLRSALAGGGQLTREALYQTLEQGGIETGGQRGYHLLWRAAQEQVLCWATRVDGEHTFALLDEWIPHAPMLSPDDAIRRLTRCYFQSHGPATLADFIWWSGLTAADVRRGLELNRDELTETEGEGKTFWSLEDAGTGASRDETADSRGGESAYLLPAFDELIVGYRNRDAVLDPAFARVVNAGGGMLSPVIVVGCSVVGIWKRSVRRERVTVVLKPFRALRRSERDAVSVEAEKYAAFIGMKLDLSIDAE